MKSSQDVTELTNKALSDDAESDWLFAPLTKLFVGYKIRPLDRPEGVETEVMDAGGEELIERPHLSAVQQTLQERYWKHFLLSSLPV